MKISYLLVVLLLIQAWSCIDGRSHQHNHHNHFQLNADLATDDPLTASKLNVYPKQLFPGELHRSQFPKGFVFGSAGSAYQVPGHFCWLIGFNIDIVPVKLI